jgi:nitroreductase
VYHFEPAEFALRRLRDGDFRARLAAAAAEPAIAGLPLCLMLTGIPWRTTWKYRERGYRHLFWDAGAIVANLLAVAAAQRAGELSSAEAVSAWRTQAGRLRAQPATRTLAAGEADQAHAAIDTIETVILRRGSTRRFAQQPLPRGALGWAMAAATRGVPGDFVPPQATLLEPFLAVHAVQELIPGAYRWDQGELHLLRAGAERARTRWLCLGQDLGGDAAATVFHCAQLEPILAALGARGYRAAQLEGGVAAERLQLAAFALGVGATGLTFLDDDVSAFFATPAAPMLTVAVGVPAYRAQAGRYPAELPSFGVADG